MSLTSREAEFSQNMRDVQITPLAPHVTAMDARAPFSGSEASAGVNAGNANTPKPQEITSKTVGPSQADLPPGQFVDNVMTTGITLRHPQSDVGFAGGQAMKMGGELLGGIGKLFGNKDDDAAPAAPDGPQQQYAVAASRPAPPTPFG